MWHAMRNTFALKCNLFSLLHAYNATHSTHPHTHTHRQMMGGGVTGGNLKGCGDGDVCGAFM